MHPSVRDRADAAAIPILFATMRHGPKLPETFPHRPGSSPRPRVHRQAGPLPDAPAPDGNMAAVVFGLEDETSSRDRSGRAPARCCRQGSIASRMRRQMRARRRWRSCSAPIVSIATASRRRPRPAGAADGVDTAEIARIAEAAALARDLINTPANDMGPKNWRRQRRRWRRGRRDFNCTVGDDLLKQNFPLIHAVGLASTRAAAADRPELGRCRGPEGHPRRQGRLVRHRRPRHQAVERHAADEEGHGRRRQRARPGAHGHGRRSSKCGCACSSRRSRMRSPAPPSARRHLQVAQGT